MELNHKYISAFKYAKLSGLSYNNVLYMCKSNKLNAIQTEGGQWQVKISFEDHAIKEDYKKVLEENARLKTINKMVNIDSLD